VICATSAFIASVVPRIVSTAFQRTRTVALLGSSAASSRRVAAISWRSATCSSALRPRATTRSPCSSSAVRSASSEAVPAAAP
jgi:hypothetical protein